MLTGFFMQLYWPHALWLQRMSKVRIFTILIVICILIGSALDAVHPT